MASFGKKLKECREGKGGLLMGESMEMNVLKDPGMLRGLNDLVSLAYHEKIKTAFFMPWMGGLEMQKHGLHTNKIK